MRRDFPPKPLLRDADVTRLVRSLPARVPPSGLTMSLRVLASRERQRAVERRTAVSIYNAWKERLRLTVQNMMRPFALPLAGGMFSAVALFSMWVVPAYPAKGHLQKPGSDVPTILTTSATIRNTASVAVHKSEVVIEIQVDEAGRVIDYEVLEGAAVLDNASVRASLENFLVFARFDPATTFGTPTRGKVRLYLNSSPSRIDVKG